MVMEAVTSMPGGMWGIPKDNRSLAWPRENNIISERLKRLLLRDERYCWRARIRSNIHQLLFV
jgi:hypothetical protein